MYLVSVTTGVAGFLLVASVLVAPDVAVRAFRVPGCGRDLASPRFDDSILLFLRMSLEIKRRKKR